MPNIKTPATRDKERTQQAILTSARSLFSNHGAGVSMADIAQAAGLSKGALTHHYPTRSDLEQAVVQQVVVLFREEVYRHVDLAENTPGKLLRGYIRAMTSDSVLMRQTFAPSSFLSLIGLKHPMLFLSVDDAEQWRIAFAADGIEPALSLTLRFAAEGLAASIDTPYLTAAELSIAREQLLKMATPQ